MQADFLDAHERHWNDAEHLFQTQRWANADHLYGMAAECGLKRLMQAFGMAVDPAGSPSEGYLGSLRELPQWPCKWNRLYTSDQ